MTKPFGFFPCFVGAAVIAALASCSNLTPTEVKILHAACDIDGLIQPVAVQVAPTVVPALSGVASADAALLHPYIVTKCAELGGTQATQVPATVTTVPVVPTTVPVK